MREPRLVLYGRKEKGEKARLRMHPNNNNIYYLYINGQEKSFPQFFEHFFPAFLRAKKVMNIFSTGYS